MPKSKTAPAAPGNSAAKPPGTSKPAPAPVASNTAKPSTVPCLIAMAVASTLSQPQLIAGIVQTEAVSRSAYSAFGKYRFYLEKRMTAEKSLAKISTVLREKCGLTASTIGHTAYAAKTFGLVVTDHLTEAEYDAMPADLMRAFVQVQQTDAKQKLGVADAIAYLRSGAKPVALIAEFDSLSEHGLTAAEAEQAADAQAEKEKREQAAKLVADKQAAADRAANEALAVKAAADKVKADKAAAEAKVKQAAAAKLKKTADTKAEKDAAEKAQKQADEDAAVAAAAQAQAKTDAKAAKAPPPATKVIATPAKATITTCGEMLDKLVDKIGELTVREQVAFFTTTWKAADSLLADSLKVAMAKAAPTKAAAKAA